MAKQPTLRQRLRLSVQKGLWKTGFHHVLPDRPSTLMVEPTNVCNLHCPACPTGQGTLNRPPRTMTFDEFKLILDQACDPAGYLKRVTLFNYGEPFLCKDLLKMVRAAADRKLETFTSTNGHFFGSDAVAREVVASGLTELIVCLDGADQQTLSRYRRNADFGEILEGIRRVVRARRDGRSDTPIVELQFIVMKHNQHQIDAMRALARDLGVDRFIEKTVGINPTDPDFQRLARELLPDDLSHSRFECRPDGVFALKGEAPCCCEYIYSTMVINSNGEVTPCCYDVLSDYVMGNVFETPLGDIWRGEKFMEFRRRVEEERETIPICAECPEGRVIRRMEDVTGDDRRP